MVVSWTRISVILSAAPPFSCRGSLCITGGEDVVNRSAKVENARTLDARQLAQQAGRPDAGLSGCAGACRGRAAACDLSAADFRRRGEESQAGAGTSRARRGFPAA